MKRITDTSSHQPVIAACAITNCWVRGIVGFTVEHTFCRTDISSVVYVVRMLGRSPCCNQWHSFMQTPQPAAYRCMTIPMIAPHFTAVADKIPPTEPPQTNVLCDNPRPSTYQARFRDRDR